MVSKQHVLHLFVLELHIVTFKCHLNAIFVHIVERIHNHECKYLSCLPHCNVQESRGARGPVLSVLLVRNDCSVRRSKAVTALQPSLE